MKTSLLKVITLLFVPILFSCFIVVLVLGFALLATTALVKFLYNLFGE